MEVLAFLRGPTGYIALHKPIIVVGRSGDCDISLDSKSISGHHAKILLEGPKNSAVIDLNSRNGTYINGTRVKNDSVPVYPGDTIRFGTDLPPFRLEFSIDKTLEPLHTSKPSEDLSCTRKHPLESHPEINLPESAENGEQGANTWFSREDITAEDCPILNIAQQEYKAAVNAARGADRGDDDLSELTIPSQCAVLEHSYTQSVRCSELSSFLQKVNDRLGTLLPTYQAASELIADLLTEVHDSHFSENNLLESILKRLALLLDRIAKPDHVFPESKLIHDNIDASGGSLSAQPSSTQLPVSISNSAEMIPSLQCAPEKDKYELQLLTRLMDYKTAVSLLKDDLFNYLQQQASTPNSIDRALSASFVELKLREHLLSGEVQRLRNSEEDHISMTETIDLLNQRIYSLISENTALKKMIDKK